MCFSHAKWMVETDGYNMLQPVWLVGVQVERSQAPIIWCRRSLHQRRRLLFAVHKDVSARVHAYLRNTVYYMQHVFISIILYREISYPGFVVVFWQGRQTVTWSGELGLVTWLVLFWFGYITNYSKTSLEYSIPEQS